ncbi:MAG: hypothetical protein JO169_06990 [Solirubrobacterales bacterium]|nr:hypothetical protein [Solirubrobacterales bacterium]
MEWDDHVRAHRGADQGALGDRGPADPLSPGSRQRRRADQAQRICSKDGKEVPYKQVAKGYEVKRGEYVLLSQQEIDAAAGDHSRLIELEEFVCAADIDPVFYDSAYYLGVRGGGGDAYRLLHDALARAGRVGANPRVRDDWCAAERAARRPAKAIARPSCRRSGGPPPRRRSPVPMTASA